MVANLPSTKRGPKPIAVVLAVAAVAVVDSAVVVDAAAAVVVRAVVAAAAAETAAAIATAGDRAGRVILQSDRQKQQRGPKSPRYLQLSMNSIGVFVAIQPFLPKIPVPYLLHADSSNR